MFSKQPVNSTYQTKTVSVIKELGSRSSSTTVDSYIYNGYVELTKNREIQEREAVIVKRAGTRSVTSDISSGAVRGAHLWKDQAKIFLAIQNNIYVYDANTQALITTLAGVFATTSGDVGFEEFQYSTAIVKVCASDGTTLITIDSSNVTAAAVGVPVHSPFIVFLDATLYVLKINSSAVYSSDIDNPLTWVDGSHIDAEMRADQAKRIALLNNYLVVFGTKTIEYFYDAANASGSPLSRNDSPIKAIGYVGGFAKFGNRIYFVGETAESSPDVYVIEDFKISSLGSESLRRHIETNLPLFGSVVSFNGHDFYVMATATATYALELENKLWNKWGWQGFTTFAIPFSLPWNSPTTGYKNYFVLDGNRLLFVFDSTIGTDNALPFTVQIVTNNEYFDSYNRKAAHRLTIYADKPVSSLPILVQTSDNDYQTWSAGQTIDLYQDIPAKYRWGMFRRRAHRLTYAGTLPLRIYKIELDLNLGNT